jgi:hypothetical protein
MDQKPFKLKVGMSNTIPFMGLYKRPNTFTSMPA